MTTAAAVGIAVYLALITSLAARIVRAWRRECRLAARDARARRRDTQPAPVDDTCLRLEALYHAPAHNERGNQ